MNFNINDKVICLHEIEKNLPAAFKIFDDSYPEKGKVYVIREARDLGVPNCPMVGLNFVGIYNKNNLDGREQCWNSFDFQLLKDAKMGKSNFGGEYDWLNKNE